MVKTIVALLTLLLVLVGPASAQDADPPQDDPAPDGADPSPDETSQGEAPSASAPEESATQTQQAAACRAVATHLADPRMSPSRWVITDPDGCIRRTIERLIGPSSFVRSIL